MVLIESEDQAVFLQGIDNFQNVLGPTWFVGVAVAVAVTAVAVATALATTDNVQSLQGPNATQQLENEVPWRNAQTKLIGCSSQPTVNGSMVL